jgi:thiamine pyrophosphokinase
MGICYIIAAGDMYGEIPAVSSEDCIIVADGGYDHLGKLGVKPDVIVGDFDSVENDFSGTDATVQKHPVIKDDTDTMLAVKIGLERGYTDFMIYGGVGGKRTDHTIANFQTLAYIAEKGARGTLVGDGEYFTVIRDGEITLEGEKDSFFSVFAYGGTAKGVSIIGSHYDVNGAELTPFFPLGVSNKFKENTVRVSVEKGCLMIVYNK